MPTIVAIGLGIGSLVGDLDADVAHFWGGRPISATSLFWTKFVTALNGVGALVLVPLVLAVLVVPLLKISGFRDFTPIFDLRTIIRVIGGEMIWLPMVLLLSMCAMAIVKQPLYAGAVSVALTVAVLLIPADAMNHNVAYVLMYSNGGAALAATVVSIALASCALTTFVWWIFPRRSVRA
jgi:hypothetical protein